MHALARALLSRRVVGSTHRIAPGLAIVLACSACATGAGTRERDEPGAITLRDAGGPGEPDAGWMATVLDLDAGPPDGGAGDVGPPDAGHSDAGPPDAPMCEPESCNGLDDDCDGMIDDGAGCPCDVRELAGRTYLFCGDARTWADARATCESVGYRLVSIADATEDAAVYGEIAVRGWSDTWIGLTDAAIEGNWLWSTGDPPAYVHWDAGEPNDGAGGEDCGVIKTVSGRESEWDDRACSSARPHVCEVGTD